MTESSLSFGERMKSYRPQHTVTCASCGVTFETKSYRKSPRFCSHKCSTRYYRASSKRAIKKKCPRCGRMFFVHKSAPTICCSQSCAAKRRSRTPDYKFFTGIHSQGEAQCVGAILIK